MEIHTQEWDGLVLSGTSTMFHSGHTSNPALVSGGLSTVSVSVWGCCMSEGLVKEQRWDPPLRGAGASGAESGEHSAEHLLPNHPLIYPPGSWSSSFGTWSLATWSGQSPKEKFLVCVGLFFKNLSIIGNK